jgi:hypothetical protein
MRRVVAAVFAYADGQLSTGKSAADVEGDLVSKGMEKDAAAAVVDKIVNERARQSAERARLLAHRDRERAAHRRRVLAMRAEAARQGMTIGAIICLVGVLVTLLGYSAAPHMAVYALAWAAILFGAIRFLRAAALASTNRAEAAEEMR